MDELEESRRKLVNLKMQKDGEAFGMLRSSITKIDRLFASCERPITMQRERQREGERDRDRVKIVSVESIDVAEKSEIEIKIEEGIQDSGRKDVKEKHQATSNLPKEMGMMEGQLNSGKKLLMRRFPCIRKLDHSVPY